MVIVVASSSGLIDAVLRWYLTRHPSYDHWSEVSMSDHGKNFTSVYNIALWYDPAGNAILPPTLGLCFLYEGVGNTRHKP